MAGNAEHVMNAVSEKEACEGAAAEAEVSIVSEAAAAAKKAVTVPTPPPPPWAPRSGTMPTSSVPQLHRQPRGRPPKGKTWHAVRGEWIPKVGPAAAKAEAEAVFEAAAKAETEAVEAAEAAKAAEAMEVEETAEAEEASKAGGATDHAEQVRQCTAAGQSAIVLAENMVGVAGVRAMLRALKLEQYAAEMEEQGYDDLEFLREQSMDATFLCHIAEAVGMKRGHALKFCMMLPGYFCSPSTSR